MDFELTDLQRETQRLTREFAARELIPHARKRDEEHRFPQEVVKKLAELSLLGVAVPEEWGGAGLDNVSYALAIEELSRGDASVGVIASVNNSLYCDPVLKFGTDAQKREWLTPFARGEKLGCFGLTEPEAGSDAAAQKTDRRPQGRQLRHQRQQELDHQRPGGRRHRALHHDRPARRGTRGITAFIVPTSTPGFNRAPAGPEDGHLRRALLLHLLRGHGGAGEEPPRQGGGRLQGRHVHARRRPHRHRLAGARHRPGRVRGGAARTRRSARRSASPSRTTRRSSSCSPTWRPRSTPRGCSPCKAALLKDQGVRHSLESAMAKLYASEMASRVANKALQIHGGYGYSKEFDVERHFRDARITEIYEGTSEIQRIVISSSLLKE